MTKRTKAYLISYNVFQFLGWSAFLVLIITRNFDPSGLPLVLLNVFQFAAMLEVVHVLTGQVKSSVSVTAMQVFSRILVLLIVNLMYSSGWDLSSGFTFIALAWGITEVVRYSYYTMQLIDKDPSWLRWFRYSFFFVLYPAGVAGELLIWIACLQKIPVPQWLSISSICLVFIVYAIFFPGMFQHMKDQRKFRMQKQ